MCTYCEADCSVCAFNDKCGGCTETYGSPFGGSCIAAEYIKAGGHDAYMEFKSMLKDEINTALDTLGLHLTDELAGSLVNLEYRLLNGLKMRLLNDEDIYLGSQIEFADMGIRYGVVADAGFIMISSFSVDGSEAELVLYRKR